MAKNKGFSVACTTGSSSPAARSVVAAAGPLLSIATFLVVVFVFVSSGLLFTNFFLFRISPTADVAVEDDVVDSFVATGRKEETGMGTVVPREGTIDACFFSSSTSICCFLSMAARKGSTSFLEKAAYLLVCALRLGAVVVVVEVEVVAVVVGRDGGRGGCDAVIGGVAGAGFRGRLFLV